jgi:hypothetical protein
MTMTSELPTLPPLIVQLEALRAAFPCFQIMIAGFGREHWFEAWRPRYEPGTCAVVAATAQEMWQALSAAVADRA